jgi:ABC-type sugar transport system ATPase subunit
VQQEMKLEVINMSGKGFSNISFQLYKGEILGFAGLQGSGRTAMAKALFGDAEIKQGSVLKDGKGLSFLHPSEAIRHGIIYLPEERKTEGLFLEKSIAENIFSSRLTKGFYKESSINLKSIQLCSTFDIRSADVTQEVRKLSGGNQQKVVMAKWLSMEPEILIVNEPTHGIDVGAKADIYRLLKNLTAEGKSIILISSDLPELLLLSDRIAVMHEGRIKSVLNRSEATEEIITTIASGY